MHDSRAIGNVFVISIVAKKLCRIRIFALKA